MSTNEKPSTGIRSRANTRTTTGQVAAAVQGKLPPQALDLEEVVLGALMLEKDALTAVIDILHKECFYADAHGKIYEAIVSLFQQSKPVDILTVTSELKRLGTLEIAGGPYYITQLTSKVASSANVEYHARIIIQKYIQRELIRISSETVREAYEETSDVFTLLDNVEKNLFQITQGNIRKSFTPMVDLVRIAIENMEKAKNQEGQEHGITGVPSGFSELDRITAGWQATDLVIIGARPGMGKTSFCLSMARNIAIRFARPVAFFSLEMSAVQIVNRLISSETGLAAEKLKRGDLAPHEWQQLNTKIGKLEDAPLYIDDTPALSIFEFRAKCRRLKAQKKIEIVIIDYLQLMVAASDNKNSNREQEISYISRSLKSIAKELDVPILVLSQLSRKAESRGGNQRPMLSDLRESGAIEQDADMVIFLYRPEYYKIDQDEEGQSTKGIAEVQIAKHRNGALKDIKLRFVETQAKFEDLNHHDQFDDSAVSPEADYNGPKSILRSSRMNEDPDGNAPF